MSEVDIDIDLGAQDVEELTQYVPKTPLGRRLMELHAEVVASGQPLLESWDDLEREVAERRGGFVTTYEDVAARRLGMLVVA
jgi:hypothetical protein